MNLDPELMDLIVCPACHGSLAADEQAGERSEQPPEAGGDVDVRSETRSEGSGVLVCAGCGRAYPVRNDIPILLVDEARQRA